MDERARSLARALLALLKGSEPPAFPLSARRDELERRSDDGDPAARGELRALTACERLPARVAAALHHERLSVVLADGSSLPLDDAEKLLAAKEARGCHRALRRSMDDAVGTIRRFTIDRIEDDRSEAAAAEDRAGLRAFLASTTSLRDAAREVLASLGGEMPDDPASLSRALDLPDDTGAFGEDQTLALLAGARDAAARSSSTGVPVGRFRAPRAMAGVVVALEDVRFAQTGGLRRYDRHARTLEAGAHALILAGHPNATTDGRAAALTLQLEPIRRALGVSRGAAERAARVAVATSVLRARAAVAAAALMHVHEARDAFGDAFGCDPGAVMVSALLTPPWISVNDGRAEQACSWLSAAPVALRLRDSFDDTWPLRPEAWAALAEPGTSTEAAAAWSAWAGALL